MKLKLDDPFIEPVPGEPLPDPPVPPGTDLRHLKYMPLHIHRLRSSAFTSKASGEVFRVAVLLWCAAYHEVPAGSLPNTLRELASHAGFGRLAEGAEEYINSVVAPCIASALHGFKLHGDGRLYHDVVVEVVIETETKTRRRKEAAVKAWKAKKKKARTLLVQPNYNGDTDARKERIGEERIGESKESTAATRKAAELDYTDTVLPTTLLERHPELELPYRALAPRIISLCGNPSLNPARTIAWLQAGADADLDILPAIASVMGRTKRPRKVHTLRYFDQVVAQATADRTASTTTATATDQPRKPHGKARTRVTAVLDAINDVFAERPGDGPDR